MRCGVVLLVAALASGTASIADAQSLADVARAEQARRKAVGTRARVYTNDDLRPDFSRPVPPAVPAATEVPPAEAADPGAPAAAGTGSAPAAAAVRDETYWRTRITEARTQLERTRAFTTAMQNRADMLWTDFVNRDDPAQRGAIERQRLEALAELERLKQDVLEQERAVAAIEEEARRAGVPPGWLRPS